MSNVFLTSTGLYRPKHSISNEELVKAFNAYVDLHNEQHAAEIAAGHAQALEYSDAAFIEKASGIKSRYVIDKQGILDPTIMHPVVAERPDDELCIQAEMAVNAAKMSFEQANISSQDIDAVIVACSNLQRAYPAISIEVQNALGIEGFAFDMNVACSSATFGLQMAQNLIAAGTAKNILVISPEICSAHLNFRDRDSHFIFGDVATACILQAEQTVRAEHPYQILSTKLFTAFSNNIRNNGGFMNRLTEGARDKQDKLFYQNGRKVFKEVTGKVVQHVQQQLEALSLQPNDLQRLWLHQANLNMNRLISEKLMGKQLSEHEAPVILDRYANTASAGSVVAFHEHQENMQPGDRGLLCSFGAGYSIGSLILEKR